MAIFTTKADKGGSVLNELVVTAFGKDGWRVFDGNKGVGTNFEP